MTIAKFFALRANVTNTFVFFGGFLFYVSLFFSIKKNKKISFCPCLKKTRANG